MDPSNRVPLNTQLFSICPDCNNPNLAGLNWCSACGCLLIGYTAPNSQFEVSSLPDCDFGNDIPYGASQFYGISNGASIHDSQPVCMPTAGEFHQFQEIPSENVGSDLTGACGVQNSQRQHAPCINDPFRLRCVSGPSDPCSQNHHGNIALNMQVSNSFLSESDLAGFVYMDHPNQPPLIDSTYINGQFRSNFSGDQKQMAQLCSAFNICNIQQEFVNSNQFNGRPYPTQHGQPANDRNARRGRKNFRRHINRGGAFNGGQGSSTNGARVVLRSAEPNSRQQEHPKGRHLPQMWRRKCTSNSATQSSGPDCGACTGDSESQIVNQNNPLSVTSTVPNISPPSLTGVPAVNRRSTSPSGDNEAKADGDVETIKPCGDDSASTAGSDAEEGQWHVRLPTELWFSIVRLLPYSTRAQLALTCRRLGNIVADPQVWRVIRLDRYQFTDSGLAAIGRKQPQQLHLSYCRGEAVTNRGLEQLFRACRHTLERFSFIGCSKGAFQGDAPLLLPALRCPRLSHLDASYAPTVRDTTIRTISQTAVALRSVKLNGAQHISNMAIHHLVHHHKQTLERLELFGCFRLDSEIFCTLGQCHQLRAVAFGFLHHLSSSGLLELVSHLPLLMSLDLRGTKELVTDTNLSQFATKCPCLEEVVLANISSVMREEALIRMVIQLPRLRFLDLCGLLVVKDATLKALFAKCPLLEFLDVSCTSITEKGLLELDTSPAMCLNSLRVSHPCSTVALTKIVRACPKLTRLSLYQFHCIDKWDFLFDVRSNLVIHTEAGRFTAT